MHDGSAAQYLRLAALIRDQGALAVSEGTQVVAIAPDPVDIDRLGFRERLVICEEDAVERAEPARPAGRPAGGGSHGACGGPPGRIDPDQLPPGAVAEPLSEAGPAAQSRAFGPLLAADRDELVRTLELLAANGFERSATATALPVHRNTLVQWIARIRDLTGLDVDDPEDRVTIWLAARARAAGDVHGAQPSP